MCTTFDVVKEDRLAQVVAVGDLTALRQGRRLACLHFEPCAGSSVVKVALRDRVLHTILGFPDPGSDELLVIAVETHELDVAGPPSRGSQHRPRPRHPLPVNVRNLDASAAPTVETGKRLVAQPVAE